MVVSSTHQGGEDPLHITKGGRIEPYSPGPSGVSVPADCGCGAVFELVLNEPAEGEGLESLSEPFATIHAGGTYSKTLLARVVLGQTSVLKHLALRIQKNRYFTQSSPELYPGANNIAVENIWRREYENLSDMSADADLVPRLIRLSADEGRGPTRWPPLIFCKAERKLFSPKCSRCGQVLSDCRDDALLIERGLPPYTSTVHRFLHCAACAEGGDEPVFYSYEAPKDLPPGKPSGEVRGWEDMRSELVAAADDGDSAADSARAVCAECSDCSVAGSDDSSGPSPAQQLTPLSFYETFAVCSELVHLQYDEFCDMLGGRKIDDLRQGPAAGGGNDGRTLRLDMAEKVIGRRGMLLFEIDGSGLDALEVFRLKLSAFAQLCRGVHELHRRCGQPHLCIEPRNALVQLTEAGDHLPAMWSFQVKLAGLSSTSAVVLDGRQSAGLYFPPDSSSMIYTAPVIRQGLFGRTQAGDFVLTDILDVGDAKDGPNVKFEGELSGENLFSVALSRKDLISVVVPGSPFGIEDLVLWCREAGGPRNERGSFKLQSEPLRLETDVIRRIRDGVGIRIPGARYAIYPCFHVPCDLYSLGMIFFRTLLVNDGQELARVELALDGVKKQLPKLSAEREAMEGERAFENIAAELRAKENANIFARRNIFHHSEDRRDDRPNAIPETLWGDALVMGLRLCTGAEGFSYCEDHGDFDLRYPAEKLEPILESLDTIIRKADSIMFSRSRHSLEVREVLDEVMLEPLKASPKRDGNRG